MSEHHATIDWQRGGREFTYEGYSRDHTWTFQGGTQVTASAAPAYKGTPELVDPEEAFVASLSACHMLTFLALCTKKRFVVERYTDEAVGHLEKNAEGRLAITRVVLRPRIEFAGENRPSPADLDAMHHKAHELCFIANSVTTEITVEAAGQPAGAP
jgi:organic hydroperoxide reductase OsmC/OhrA